MTLEQVLRRLYAAEISCGVHAVWDGGWVAWVGGTPDRPTRRAHFLEPEELASVPAWLIGAALEMDPEFRP